MTTTLNLPTWYDVAECEAMLVPEVRAFPGPYGGPTEVQDLLGDRWQFRHQLPDGDFNHGGRTAALFNRLRGGTAWLRLHHLARPVPRGTARGSMVLAAAAAQGADSLQLAGLRATPNLAAYGGFLMDSNADGISDGASSYSGGTVTGISFDRGGGYQNVYVATLGSTSADRAGIGLTNAIPVTAGVGYVASALMGSTAGTQHSIEVACYTAGDVYISSAGYAAWAGAGAPSARQVAFTTPAGTAKCVVYLYMHTNTVTTPVFQVRDFQFELGAAATPFAGLATLRAGDMLGHNGEQLVEVFDDATADDAGTITVTLTGRLRKAIASGQVITWDRPSIPCMLTDTGGVPTAYTRGRARGQSVQFVEAWT